jgi:hypothetical protein
MCGSKVCFSFLLKFRSKHQSLSKYLAIYAEAHTVLVKSVTYCCTFLTKIGMRRKILVKLSKIKFYKDCVNDCPVT